MYRYDTLNSTFANQTHYWKTVPSKIDILQLMIVSLEIMYWRNPIKTFVFENSIFDETALY